MADSEEQKSVAPAAGSAYGERDGLEITHSVEDEIHRLVSAPDGRPWWMEPKTEADPSVSPEVAQEQAALYEWASKHVGIEYTEAQKEQAKGRIRRAPAAGSAYGGLVPRKAGEFHHHFEIGADKELSACTICGRQISEGQCLGPDWQAEVSQTYAQARKEALVAEAEASTSVMPTPDELIAMNLRTHEEAIQAVYQLGVAAGAKMVQFRDAHVEKELKQIPVDLLWQIGLRLDRVLAHAGKKSQLGLKKARKLVSEMYAEARKEQD